MATPATPGRTDMEEDEEPSNLARMFNGIYDQVSHHATMLFSSVIHARLHYMATGAVRGIISRDRETEISFYRCWSFSIAETHNKRRVLPTSFSDMLHYP